MGIYILVLILASIIAVILFNYLYDKGYSLFISFIVSIISIYLSRHMFAARSHIISFLIFALELFSLQKFLEKGEKKYFFVLIILPIVLVNAHSTVFPIYIALMMPYLAEIVLSKIKLLNIEESNKIEYSDLKNKRVFIALIIISLFTALITPVFGSAYSTMFLTMKGISQSFVAEMKSVNLLEVPELLFIFVLTMAILIFSKTKVNVKDLLFIIGFLILSLTANRSLYFMYLFGIVFFTNICFDFINTYFEKNKIDGLITRIENSKIVNILIVFIIVLISINGITKRINSEYIDDLNIPIEITDWILKNVDYENARIWTHYNFGSYLEFKGIKPFLDSRAELFSKELNQDTSILEDWTDVVDGKINYKQIFNKYGITHALLYNNELINQYIYGDEDYELIYQDDIFSLYERK